MDDETLKDYQWSAVEQITYLNHSGPKEEQRCCNSGEHNIGINDFARPQCSRCLMLMDWKAVKVDLMKNKAWSKTAEQQYKELKSLARRVEMGDVKEMEKTKVLRYRYLTGQGYQYIERVFYEPI